MTYILHVCHVCTRVHVCTTCVVQVPGIVLVNIQHVYRTHFYKIHNSDLFTTYLYIHLRYIGVHVMSTYILTLHIIVYYLLYILVWVPVYVCEYTFTTVVPVVGGPHQAPF